MFVEATFAGRKSKRAETNTLQSRPREPKQTYCLPKQQDKTA